MILPKVQIVTLLFTVSNLRELKDIYSIENCHAQGDSFIF